MERWYYANKQCSWREYIEISGIPASLADNDLKSKVFEVLKELASQSTLAWLRIAVAYPPKVAKKSHHKN